MIPATEFEGEMTVESYTVYAFGHDFGNAEINGVLIKGGKALMKAMPTAFAKVSTTSFASMGVDTTDAIVIQFQDEGAEWGIGQIALAQSNDPWHGRGDLMRYASKHSLRAILAISASLVTDKEYGLLVTCGLPAETFQHHPELRKDIKKAISGTHVFTLDSGKTWRTVHLEYATTLMEGAGALMTLAKRENTGPAGAAVIDIGGRTTDLYVSRQSQPVVALCQGKPIGVVTAEKALRTAFEKKYQFQLNDLEARQIMFAYANTEGLKKKPYPEISNYGTRITPSELERLADEAVTETTAEIVSFVSAAWRESDTSLAIAVRFDPCICIGGGAYYFFDALKKRIKHLQRPENPVYANAHGYAKASARMLEKRKLQQEVSTAKTAASTAVAVTATTEPGPAEDEQTQA